MRRILIVNIICFVSIIAFAQTIENRIVPPDGYIRKKCDGNSFAAYLRQLPLFPEGSKVKLYNGQEKQNQSAAYSVINMEIGNLDLQQCADAVIRLRAEYLWVQKRYGEIKFNFTSGFPVEYTKWAEGKRIKVSGNKAEWYAAGGRDYSYKTFRKYLDMVFMYAGTASLAKELQTVPYTSLQPGDVFIKGGSPGHAVIVMDIAIHPTTKKKVFLLAQSYMPAQQIHILVNPSDRNLSPWYELTDADDGNLYTPEWTFAKKDLKRFK
ncbi:DUF4846 domain-containing protein [Bacteroides faecichinchillae]|uniref:DUF4846 domain-containing protein n=1 Tax=Bacteroides faecichinchillae TaxID=871325 RepID=A0A1M4WY03_9BACE|nr:DUF4846 domain-containing protein [Bacteroides faecichinchillae]THG68812.1 hypothetical protein E5981_03420 [Bacteroides faecichinchillae]SHE86075.1 protein of unknown function (4846) [Bacteroides faecichinchillae]